MKIRTAILCAVLLLAGAGAASAQGPKLDGAYKFVGLKFPNGQQTEADAKGMLVVHGKYMAMVRASVDRPTWAQGEDQAAVQKKMAEAFNGLAATAGMFEVQGNTIILNQTAQAVPMTMGKPSKWEYKLEGNRLTLKPAGNANVEFYFERLPE